MTISYRTAITIVQCIFFTPAVPLTIWLCVKDGIRQASTWRFVATLSLLRIAGDIAYFVSLSHPNINAEAAVIVCELLGLAPLMLIMVAFVARVNRSTKTYPGKASLIISLASLSGLILGVLGTDSALKHANTTSDVHTTTLMQAALGLFIASFGVMLLIFFLVLLDTATNRDKRIALGKEMGLLYTVSLASPFVLVRFIYAALGDYSGNPRFSVLYGDNTTYFLMDVLMEMCAVAICLLSAFFVPAPKKLAKEEQTPDGTGSRVNNEEGQKTDETGNRARDQQEPIELGSKPENKSDTEHEKTSVQDSELA